MTYNVPKVTYSDPKAIYSDPKVTHRDPKHFSYLHMCPLLQPSSMQKF